jgi:hypothetical protein
MRRTIAVLWKEGHQPKGQVEVANGRLGKLTVTGEGVQVSPAKSAGTSPGSHRMQITVEEANLTPGAAGTRILIRGSQHPFGFFLRDVNSDYPIYLPDHGAIVTDGEDTRSFEEIERGIQQRGLLSRLQQIESENEENYGNAAANTRILKCPTWLGLSRDVRIFEVDFIHTVHNSAIRPRLHGTLVQREGKPLTYAFVLGRGAGCVEGITRGIEDGMLPILHVRRVDDDVTYDCVVFASLEWRKLSAENLRGTHFLVADGYAVGHRFTEQQEAEHRRFLPEESGLDEETVLYFRVVATNTSDVPRYAWLMAPTPNHKADYDGERGFGLMPDGTVFSVNLLNGKPLPHEEMAVLLPPGKSAKFEFRIPHGPISKERAARLSEQDFERRYAECRSFWKGKLKSAAELSLPEQRIDEMMHAGLLHLDIVAYGREPDGPVAPTIGVYSPIGSESSPIIQFMDSMGWHDLARRCLNYFLEKQHDDGFMQNFDGYMLETGAALWNIGEHYRYTRDEDWVKEIAPKVLKSCEYIINWRRRNLDEGLRGRGYGLLDGKVADPEDQTRQFVLNGYAYLGLARTAEMLASCDPAESAKLAHEASALRDDIRTALSDAMVHSRDFHRPGVADRPALSRLPGGDRSRRTGGRLAGQRAYGAAAHTQCGLQSTVLQPASVVASSPRGSQSLSEGVLQRFCRPCGSGNLHFLGALLSRQPAQDARRGLVPHADAMDVVHGNGGYAQSPVRCPQSVVGARQQHRAQERWELFRTCFAQSRAASQKTTRQGKDQVSR